MQESILGQFETANWILLFLGIFLFIIILLGILYNKKISSVDDLTVAGRKLSFVFLVPSIVATWICAGAMMGAAGESFLFGMQGVIFDPWAPALCMVLIGIFFAYRMRKARYTTVTDFYNHRYGNTSGLLYTIIQILASMAWLGGQLVALGSIIYLTTGYSLQATVIIASVAVIIITSCGGLWATSRIDAISFLLIVIGLLIIFPAVLNSTGGFTQLLDTAENWAELPAWSMKIEGGEEGYLWYTGFFALFYYISAWTALSLGDVPSQVLMQRALAAKNEKTAVAGFLTSGLLYLTLGMIPVIVGIAIFTSGSLDGIAVDQAKYILPWAANNYLAPWAGILFILSLVAAIISTSGDTALTMATLIGHNFYRLVKPDAPDKKILTIIRIFIPVVTLGAMVIALYFETIYRLIVLSGGIQLATISAAYIIGYFWTKANAAGAISSFVTGLVSWIIIYLVLLPETMLANMDILVEGQVYMEWARDDALFISLVPAAVISFLTMIIVSLLTQKKYPSRPMLTNTGESMKDMPAYFWSKGA